MINTLLTFALPLICTLALPTWVNHSHFPAGGLTWGMICAFPLSLAAWALYARQEERGAVFVAGIVYFCAYFLMVNFLNHALPEKELVAENFIAKAQFALGILVLVVGLAAAPILVFKWRGMKLMLPLVGSFFSALTFGMFSLWMSGAFGGGGISFGSPGRPFRRRGKAIRATFSRK